MNELEASGQLASKRSAPLSLARASPSGRSFLRRVGRRDRASLRSETVVAANFDIECGNYVCKERPSDPKQAKG